ncbi:MAG: hypothetical protein FWG50_07350, partial [Kiritimatiellaeota bacterium]|nr:hypothetical protein [Kiritimatiellota bacterium]
MNLFAKNRYVFIARTAALAAFVGTQAFGVDFTRGITSPAGNEWWATGTWDPSDWINGAGNRAFVTNTAAAATTLTLAAPVTANALTFSGGASMYLAPVTAGSPESFTLSGSDQTVDVSFVAQANEVVFDVPFIGGDVTLYSVGTGPGGSGYTGGVSFGEHLPVWDTLRIKRGHLLFREIAALYDGYTNYPGTVILDGGGITSRNYGNSGVGSGIINFPVKVSPAGGWWRTYGNGALRLHGILSDEIPGDPGVFRHTDGGSFYITNSLANFSGTLRNEAGTLLLTDSALDFTGRIDQAATVCLGNYDDLQGATLTLSMTITSTAGSLNSRMDNGTVVLAGPVDLFGYFDVRGSAPVRLT